MVDIVHLSHLLIQLLTLCLWIPIFPKVRKLTMNPSSFPIEDSSHNLVMLVAFTVFASINRYFFAQSMCRCKGSQSMHIGEMD